MKKITFESYTEIDVDNFVTNLREADKLEAYAMGYDSLKDALETSLECAYSSRVAKGENGGTHCINEMLKEHDRLYNYISVYNDKSIRWLKRLGASFSEPFLLNGEQFLLFILGGD